MGPEWVELADVHILSESTVGSSSLAPDYKLGTKLDLPFTPTDAQMSTFSMVTYNATRASWRGLIDDARKEGYSKFFVSGAGGGARTSFAALPPWFEEMVDYIVSLTDLGWISTPAFTFGVLGGSCTPRLPVYPCARSYRTLPC